MGNSNSLFLTLPNIELDLFQFHLQKFHAYHAKVDFKFSVERKKVDAENCDKRIKKSLFLEQAF